MGKCKTKTIQTDWGPFRHNQAFPGIIQAHSAIFRTLCNPDIFGTVIYPKPWHIQNQKHIQNPGIFTTLIYSEPRYIQKASIFKIWGIFRIAEIVNGYNYFHKLIIFAKLTMLSISWNRYLEVVSPEIVILCKKLWCARGSETVNIYIYNYWYIQIN